MKADIAIIDNGICDGLLKNPISFNMEITEDKLCKEYDCGEQVVFHGTNCAMIIEKYYPEAILNSIRILDDYGKGIIDKLQPALEWCYQNNIKLVNLSLGTTHYKDRENIRNVINHYANKGIIIVAASANNGYKTYPASFSNVIGVIAGNDFETDIDIQKQLGIDFIAPSEHEIISEGGSFKLAKSNSYAAPYITAMLGSALEKEQYGNVCDIRRKLLPDVNFSYYPDWIENAWVSGQCIQSKAEYYFKEIRGKLEECLPIIDTIVVYSKEEFELYHTKDKHVVYLGIEPIEKTTFNKYFWSRQQRVEQIVDNDKAASDIEIPIIIFKISEQQDCIYWLSELRECFAKDGYNVYVTSSHVESVLYDLEFLPEELCNKSHWKYVHNFLYWQTYYSQSDALMLGFKNKVNDNMNELETIADMVIDVTNIDKMVKVNIYCDGRSKMEEIINLDGKKAIQLLYQKILKFFMEDEDEQ